MLHLHTADGVRLYGMHVPRASGAPEDVGIVLAHGFTGSVRKPAVLRLASRLARAGAVLAVDFRGHGRSSGRSSLGDTEVLDVDAAVAELRRRGVVRVATVGFSMGGAVVLRHAAASPTAGGLAPVEPVQAVVSVSAPSRWYIRDTVPMRRVHWLAETRVGRLTSTLYLRTRLGHGWTAEPESPRDVVERIPPTPLLIVHGDSDAYFPALHGRVLAERSRGGELWAEPGFGHAEAAMTPELADRLVAWLADRLAG